MGTPTLDFDQLLERCMGNLEFAERVLGRFEGRLESDVDELKMSLGRGVEDEITRVAHRIKGSCANVGAEQLKQLSEDLERVGRDSRVTDPQDWIKQIDTAYEELTQTIRQREWVDRVGP